MKFKTDAREIINNKIRKYLFNDRNRVAPGDFKKLQRSSQVNITLNGDLQDLLYDQEIAKDIRQFGSNGDYGADEQDYDKDDFDFDYGAGEYEVGNEGYEYEERNEEYDHKEGSGEKEEHWVYEENNTDTTHTFDEDTKAAEIFLKEEDVRNEVKIDDYRTPDYESEGNYHEQTDSEYEYTETISSDTNTDDSFEDSDESLTNINDNYQARLLKSGDRLAILENRKEPTLQ